MDWTRKVKPVNFALGFFVWELERGTIAIDFDVREMKPAALAYAITAQSSEFLREICVVFTPKKNRSINR